MNINVDRRTRTWKWERETRRGRDERMNFYPFRFTLCLPLLHVFLSLFFHLYIAQIHIHVRIWYVIGTRDFSRIRAKAVTHEPTYWHCLKNENCSRDCLSFSLALPVRAVVASRRNVMCLVQRVPRPLPLLATFSFSLVLLLYQSLSVFFPLHTGSGWLTRTEREQAPRTKNDEQTIDPLNCLSFPFR